MTRYFLFPLLSPLKLLLLPISFTGCVLKFTMNAYLYFRTILRKLGKNQALACIVGIIE